MIAAGILLAAVTGTQTSVHAKSRVDARLAELAQSTSTVLYVDCQNGSDAWNGESWGAALRSVRTALERLGSGTGEVRVAAGVCPNEGGLRLGPQAQLVGAGARDTRIEDKVIFQDFGCINGLQINRMVGVTVNGFQDEVHSIGCESLVLRLEDVYVKESLIATVWDDVGVELTRSAVPFLQVRPVPDGMDLLVFNSAVGRVDVLTGSDSTLQVEDSTVGSLTLNAAFARVSARVRRSSFRGRGIETGFQFLNGRRTNVLVTDSVFSGYATAVDVRTSGSVDFSHNTVARVSTCVAADVVQLRAVGNNFASAMVGVTTPAWVDLRAVSWNNFFQVAKAGCFPTCFETAADLNSQDFAEANMSARPLFAAPQLGDFRLQNGSALIDAGPPAEEGRSDLDHDGHPRPVDGDGNGIAVHDVGAFELAAPQGVERTQGGERSGRWLEAKPN